MSKSGSTAVFLDFLAVLAEERGSLGRDHVRALPYGHLFDLFDSGRVGEVEVFLRHHEHDAARKALRIPEAPSLASARLALEAARDAHGEALRQACEEAIEAGWKSVDTGETYKVARATIGDERVEVQQDGARFFADYTIERVVPLSGETVGEALRQLGHLTECDTSARTVLLGARG